MADRKTAETSIIKGKNYRISILTDRLIRLEYSKKNVFVDEETAAVTNRNFPEVKFDVLDSEDRLVIVTEYLRIIYDKKEFSGEGLRINVSGNYGTTSSVWYYGDKNESLKGTTRTLDNIDGETELSEGIVSRKMWSVVDDSNSMLITKDGFKLREDRESVDLYFFGYGMDFLTAIRDFYTLSGALPLLPRFTLGNWWSRYYKYTQKSYLELMERFKKEEIPFSVAVIDMDWHLTEVEERFGTGWTGYTWNKELFPSPEDFLEELHKGGYRVILNVHPADGIRAYEDCYDELAKFMGVDTKKEEPVLFDIADEKFREGYFKYVHHPLEKQGVDYWWIDWQQGENSGHKGLDPLWLLNYFHYKDSAKRESGRGLILSRYAGVGSHKYPIGFSGDTIITWQSLDFQPYFTATASNIGYAWWSHDIGGHMNGIRDDEMFVRWVQFGVFSPIMRLHSTCNEFSGKEPWKYNLIAENIVKRYLRLRHRFIPYLYTMNRRAHVDKLPLILPLYYYEPVNDKVYDYKNEYYFGNDLIVCPITVKIDEKSGLSKTKIWLPEGNWFDIFTGVKYSGNRELEIYRDLEDIAVFAREGSILTLATDSYTNDIKSPSELDLHIFTGKAGEFTLAEDEKEFTDFIESDWAYTRYENCGVKILDTNDKNLSYSFKIHPQEGNALAAPPKRKYNLYFHGIGNATNINIFSDKKPAIPVDTEYDKMNNTLIIRLPYISVASALDVEVETESCSLYDSIQGRIFNILNNAQIEYDLKTKVMEAVRKYDSTNSGKVIGEIYSVCENEYVKGAIIELLSAR